VLLHRRPVGTATGAHHVNMGAALFAALLLASCAGADISPQSRTETLTARFERGGLVDVIVVTAIDRLPLRSAVLVVPEGERTPAYSLDLTNSPVDQPPLGEAVLMATPGSLRPVTRINAILSVARIRLPDPVNYGNIWRQSRIELHFGDPGGGERDMTLPAPAPPT
jgi:hypothetical protein